MYRILWAEDDITQYEHFYRKILSTFLQRRSLQYEIIHAIDGNAVFRHLTTGACVNLLVVDIDMPHWNGFQTAQDIAERFPGLPIIVVSANANMPSVKDQLELMLSSGVLKGYFYSDDSNAWCEAIAKTIENSPITMLHLSDIHFGRFYGLHRSTVKLESLISAQFKRLTEDNKIDLLIVSGDFCSEGRVTEFQQATDFLSAIAA
jgi:CheY-like chemotaxis protein